MSNFNITLELAQKLIASQFHEYADLTVTEVEQQGQIKVKSPRFYMAISSAR